MPAEPADFSGRPPNSTVISSITLNNGSLQSSCSPLAKTFWMLDITAPIAKLLSGLRCLAITFEILPPGRSSPDSFVGEFKESGSEWMPYGSPFFGLVFKFSCRARCIAPVLSNPAQGETGDRGRSHGTPGVSLDLSRNVECILYRIDRGLHHVTG